MEKHAVSAGSCFLIPGSLGTRGQPAGDSWIFSADLCKMLLKGELGGLALGFGATNRNELDTRPTQIPSLKERKRLLACLLLW